MCLWLNDLGGEWSCLHHIAVNRIRLLI
jgi:hypothetical protein